MSEHTRPSDRTRSAERSEAEQHAGPDRMPTPDEERIASQREPDPAVAEHEREMLERGKRQRGEGRLP